MHKCFAEAQFLLVHEYHRARGSDGLHLLTISAKIYESLGTIGASMCGIKWKELFAVEIYLRTGALRAFFGSHVAG